MVRTNQNQPVCKWLTDLSSILLYTLHKRRIGPILAYLCCLFKHLLSDFLLSEYGSVCLVRNTSLQIPDKDFTQ